MKILYVEDDLSGTIDRLIRLFEKYLNKQAIDDLRSLNNDEYGGTTDEIKEVVESTNIIEIADSFPAALQKIVNDYERYACFIVDRNLIDKKPYSFQEINQIDHNYDNALYEKYREREGDYLLVWLGTKSPSVLQKFNFLSAYPKDHIRGIETIQTFIDMKKFKEEQFFDKDDEGIVKLKKKIDRIDALNVKEDNRIYLEILSYNLHANDADLFLQVLLRKDDQSLIINNLKIIRNLLDGMLKKLEKIIPSMKEKCSGYGKRKTIDWLAGEKYANGDQKYMDSLVQNFSKSIWIISSDAIHDLIKPTTNTLNSLVYAMKDVLLWFGDQCKQKK